jgi:hypothetical protein
MFDDIDKIFSKKCKYAVVSLIKLILDEHREKFILSGLASFESFSEMYIHGLIKLFKIKDFLEEKIPSPDNRLLYLSDISKKKRPEIIEFLFFYSIYTGVYDSRSRTLLKSLIILFNNDDINLFEVEEKYSHLLVSENMDCSDQNQKYKSKNKTILTSAAFIVGGVLVGVTGGLAAPLIGVALSSVLTSIGVGAGITSVLSGTALITSLFGIYGAGLSSFRMHKRTRGITEFFFIHHDPESLHSFLNPPKENSSLENLKSFFKKKKKDEDTLKTNNESKITSPSDIPSVTITISGWINCKDDIVNLWDLNDKFMDHYSLCFDSKTLMDITQSVESVLLYQAVGYATSEVLKKTIISGVISSMIWPMVIHFNK